MLYFLMILFCSFLNASIQLLLKKGMLKIGTVDFSFENLGPFCLSLLENPYIILGIFLQPVSLGIWILVLSRVDVSYAYPLISLAYVFTALGGYFFLSESLSLERIFGILVIMGGVYLVTRS